MAASSSTMRILLLLVLGAVLGGAFVYWFIRNAPQGRRRLGSALLIASFIYVAFAMAAMESTWLLIEIGGVALFAGFVALGARHSLLWLAAGWALHAMWDVGLHVIYPSAFAPLWYPVLCISFDLIVAVYIIRRVRKSRISGTVFSDVPRSARKAGVA